MAELAVQVLGPVRATVGGAPLELAGAKARSILAVLALGHDRVVARGELVTAVWGEAHPTGADHSLQQHVSTLRRLLEPHRETSTPSDLLVTQSPGYLLRVDALDADQFARDAARGADDMTAGRAEAALDAFDDALGAWQGEALADVRGGAWFDATATRLEEQRLVVVESRAESLVALGRDAAAVQALDAHVDTHPYRERARSLHMLALYRCGRHADALASFQVARTRLGEDLGLEPGRPLRDLEQAILDHDPALGEARAAGATDPRTTFRSGSGPRPTLRLPDGQLIALTDGTTLIGRVPEAGVRLSDSRVSRHHAQIDSTDGRHVVRDLDSTNGTTINGRAADGRELAIGDVLSIGGLEITVTVELT